MAKPIHMNVSPGRKADVILANMTPRQGCFISREELRTAFQTSNPVAELCRMAGEKNQGPAGGSNYLCEALNMAIGLIREKGWNRTA